MTKAKPVAEGKPFRNSGFVILSTFVIWHSSFPVHRLYERPSLRLSPIAEESRLHCGGGAHARAGYRSQHRHLQRGQRRLVAPVALPGIRSAGLAERTQ